MNDSFMLMMMMTMKNVIPFFSPGTNAFISSFFALSRCLAPFHSIPRSFRFQFSILINMRLCVSVCNLPQTEVVVQHEIESFSEALLCFFCLHRLESTLDRSQRRRRRFGRREGFEFRCWVSNVHDIRSLLHFVLLMLLPPLDSGRSSVARSISILLNQFNRNEFILLWWGEERIEWRIKIEFFSSDEWS